MARKRTIQKGSIHVYRGKLRLKIRIPNEFDNSGKPKYLIEYTGLSDTARGRELANMKLEKLYMKLYHGIGAKQSTSVLMVEDAFAEFLAFKTRMPSTIKNYLVVKRAIIKGNYPISKEKLERDIQEFVNSGQHSKSTVNSYLTHIRSFLTFLREEKDIPVPNNILKRYSTKQQTKVLEFTDNEIELILSDHCDVELRDMLIVMVETGARPVDVLTLKSTQVDVKSCAVVWKNKITKENEVRPISIEAMMALQRRLEHCVDGKVFRWSHSSLSRVTRTFKTLLERVGVPVNNRSLKHLRTTYKRRLMEKNMPFEIQMYLMRHRSPNVTLGNYTAVSMQQVKEYL